MILLAVLFSLAHSPTNKTADSDTEQAISTAPEWSVNARAAIGGPPVDVVRGGKPETSLWFIDENTIVISFVTDRKAAGDPKLSRRGFPDETQPWELHAIFIDAASGKVRTTTKWPVQSKSSSIVATYEGKLVILTGNKLVLYSTSLKQLRELTLPPSELRYSTDVGSVSPTGQTILFTSGGPGATLSPGYS